MSIAQQEEVVRLQRAGLSREQIAEKLRLSFRQVKSRIESFHKRARLDPELLRILDERGLTDLKGLHSGWLIEKDKNGAGESLYFYLGPDQERIDFADAVREALSDISPLPKIKPTPKKGGKDVCNVLPLADLHCGTEYGNPEYEAQLKDLIDRVVSRLPPAEKAVVIDLGDLLDANDHKGVTPASGNNCDVVRDDFYGQLKLAIRIMKHAIYRLAETHKKVEVHMMRGNHDETAYMGVLLALIEHFGNSKHVKIIDSVDDYRVIMWGECGIFPNHGDKAKFEQLRDVWIADFADEWAAAKAQRIILTAHFHSLKVQELAGATGEGCRSTAKGTRYVHLNGWRSKRGLCAITLHKTEGEIDRTPSILRKAA